MNTLLAPILQYFFTEHLASHKQVSPRTLIAYRDSFRLLLQFLKKQIGKAPSSLCVDDLDAPAILAFLQSLEEQRGNQVCSRNARLTAIRSFFHVVALREPKATEIAFPSVRGAPLSSDGLDYLLQQAVKRSAEACPSLLTKRVTPHLIRHYLPFRTMSGTGGPLRIWIGDFRLRRAKAPDITRHSLMPATDCSGGQGAGCLGNYRDPAFRAEGAS